MDRLKEHMINESNHKEKERDKNVQELKDSIAKVEERYN